MGTLGEFGKALDVWDGDTDPSVEEFKIILGKFYWRGEENSWGGDIPFEGPPPYAKIVDVTGRDMTQIDGVDAALGLQRSSEESYDEIVKRVLARDHRRDKESQLNTKIQGEIRKEVQEALKNAKTTEKQDENDRRTRN